MHSFSNGTFLISHEESENKLQYAGPGIVQSYTADAFFFFGEKRRSYMSIHMIN